MIIDGVKIPTETYIAGNRDGGPKSTDTQAFLITCLCIGMCSLIMPHVHGVHPCTRSDDDATVFDLLPVPAHDAHCTVLHDVESSFLEFE